MIPPSFWGSFGNLFNGTPNWGRVIGLIGVTLTVNVVESTYPEYAWLYVGILLLGMMLTLPNFGTNLASLVKR